MRNVVFVRQVSISLTATIAVSAASTGGLPGSAAAAQCVSDSWTDYTFDRFTLHLDSQAGSDHVLVGTHSGGVIDWNAADNTFIKYTRADHCLSENLINGVAIDSQGGYWAVTNFGVNHLPAASVGDPAAQWTQISDPALAGQLFTCIAIDALDRKWIGTFDGGIFRLNESSWINFNVGNSGLSDNLITSIGFDLQGNAWIGAWGDGVDRFDGTNWINFNPQNTGTPPGLCGLVTNPPDELGLLSAFVRVAGVDPSTGDMWFINDDDSFCVPAGNGATKFDGKNWSTFTSGNSGLLTDFLGDIGFAPPPNGDILFGTFNGISRFDGANWTTIFEGDARAFATVGNAVWAGTGSGLVRIEGEKIARHDTGQLADSYVPGIVIEKDGSIWFATRNGAQRLMIDAKGVETWERFHTGNSPIVGNDLTSVAIDVDGGIWFGTFGQGVSRFDGADWASYPEATVGQVVAIAAGMEPGVVWFADNFGGVKKFDNGNWFSFTTGNSGIPSNLVHDVAVDSNGMLWVATTSGVGRFDGAAWTTFSTTQGLPSNIVRTIAPLEGAIWIGTADGASAFDGASWTNYLPGADVRAISAGRGCDVWISVFNEGLRRFDGTDFTPFATADGLINDRAHALARAADGTLWIGTELGVSRLDGEESNPADIAPATSGGNGTVDVDDLLLVINNWGNTGPDVADIMGNGIVDVDDLLAVINAWGACE